MVFFHRRLIFLRNLRKNRLFVLIVFQSIRVFKASIVALHSNIPSTILGVFGWVINFANFIWVYNIWGFQRVLLVLIERILWVWILKVAEPFVLVLIFESLVLGFWGRSDALNLVQKAIFHIDLIWANSSGWREETNIELVFNFVSLPWLRRLWLIWKSVSRHRHSSLGAAE